MYKFGIWFVMRLILYQMKKRLLMNLYSNMLFN